MRIFAWIITTAALAAACASTTPPPKYAIDIPSRHARLPNGMRVILLPDRTSKLVQIDLHVEVGANEDPPGKAGLAHLVGHLMFDQHALGPDQPTLGAVLREHALAVHAFTQYDYTHYTSLARADELKNVLALEAARLATGCPSIDDRAFARERQIVRNEVRLRSGTVEAQLRATVQRLAYPAGHPYARALAGDEEQLGTITLEDVCRFVHDYYVPERATVILAGNIAEAEAGRAVDATLASLEPRAGKPRVPVPPLQIESKTLTIEADVGAPLVFGVWALPPRYTRDFGAIGYILRALGRTFVSKLPGTIEFPDSAPFIAGGALAPALALELRAAKPDDIEPTIEAAKQVTWTPSWYLGEESDFERNKTLQIGDVTKAVEALSIRAVEFGELGQYDAEGKYFAGELERTRALSSHDIRATLDRVLDGRRTLIVVVKPRRGPMPYAQAERRFVNDEMSVPEELSIDRGEAARPLPVPNDLGAAEAARRFVLPNGLHVVLLPTEQPTPVVTAKLVFMAGNAQSPPDKAGLAELVAGGMYAPSSTQHGEGQGSVFAAFGIDEDTEVDDDSTVFTFRGLSIYQDLLLEGMGRMFGRSGTVSGSYGSAADRREKELQRPGLRARERARRRCAEALYGAAHPYAATADATPASIRRIEARDAEEFTNRYYVGANATLIVVGRFDVERAERAIRQHLAQLDRGVAATPVTARPGARSGRVVVGVESEDGPVLRVRLAYPSASGAERAAHLVLAEMLEHIGRSMKARLGASYDLSASYRAHLGPSAYEIDAAVDADRGAEALRALRSAIDGLRQGDAFLDEFVRARRAVLARLVSDLGDSRVLARQLADLAVQSLPLDAIDSLRRDVGALTPPAVMALINTELRSDAEVIVAVGSRAKLARMFDGAGVAGAVYDTRP